MSKRIVAWWTVISLTLAALAIVRLAEVFIKRELSRRTSALQSEIGLRRQACQDTMNRRDALRVDLASARAQARMAPEEPYLLMKKTLARGQIMMGEKVIYEFRFRVRGNLPLMVKGQVPEFPEGVLAIQSKEDHTAWYRPDWMYERAKQQVPVDSNERKVDDAFGRYALLLGGGVALHGPVSKNVPPDAADHIYAELGDKDLKAVFNALKVGSAVLIRH
jgi:hypothetical protein